MKTETHVTLLEANAVNVQVTFDKIQKYADDNGFRIMGEMKTEKNLLGFTKQLSFDSKHKMKTLRNYINRLDKKVGFKTANLFLHFLFKKVYKVEASVSVELSEKETKIQTLRKSWKKAFAESEKLRLEYRTEKGDFYKKQLVK